ncbi:hypothetical protein IAG25_40970 [Caballeronia sp. EK]|uniref:hypothetical protein n=1 Tax=Caballeronia sp. EK TaxID=2767469 RepID=UPI001655B983|nr:hypothetical protein [Caballeronia sp. EK]MBC8643069.1 hypothetical protein [Caballeronia sp. EK]
MADIIGLTTHHRSPRLELLSSHEHIVKSLQSVDFSDPASIQQTRDSICSALGDALGDHLFEHGAKQSALQQVANCVLTREAQRQGYGDVLGLTSQDTRTAQVILVSLLSQVGVSTFVPGELNHDHGHEALAFHFDSGREPLDTLMMLSFPAPNLGYELKDLPGGGEQFVSSLHATALIEARHLDPEELDLEIQAAETRLNSLASTNVQSKYASSQAILSPHTELPPEVLLKIQSYMHSQDLNAMRCANKEFSNLDALEVAKAKALTKRIAKMGSTEDFEAVFLDFQKLSAGYRQKPVETLIASISWLPKDLCRTLLNRIIAVTEQHNTDDKARSWIAIMLLEVMLLTRKTTKELFERTLSAIEQLNGPYQNRSFRLLAILAGRIRWLDDKGARKIMFDRILARIGQVNGHTQGIVLGKLAGEITGLPREERFASCERILDAIEQFDPCDRHRPLIAFAGVIYRVARQLPSDQVQHTIGRLLGTAAQLNFTDRKQICKVLADNVGEYVHSSQRLGVIKNLELALELRSPPRQGCAIQ